MSNLIPFQFDTKEIRVFLDGNQNPWWVLSDACAALGIANAPDAARRS